ncbi:MAG: DUF6231 family protein [Polycyclovorans sp.]|nr:DUF6231 family protein [Polycyclovorans sp.]
MSWRAQLEARLREIQPASVCALDAAARQLAGDVLPGTPLALPTPQPPSPCALALGIDALDGLDADAARQLIGRTRLYVAPHILMAVPAGCALDEAMFRALGFTLRATDAAGMRIHEYDIETYKSVPDWLNSRFWANPERWQP